MKPIKLFERKTVRDNIHLTDKEIAPLIGRSAESVADIRRRILGVVKPQHRFKKGHTPLNKGLPAGHSHAFKKGHTPVTKKTVGTIFTRSNKGVKRYYIITDDCRQYPYQKFIMEQHLGHKIPDDSVVVFLDKNLQNFDLSNLKVLTKRESLLRNHNPAKGNRTKKKQREQLLELLGEYGIKGTPRN